VIITVDENDLQQLAQWPISDNVLARLLNNIKAQEPRIIALDIYRDFPIAPSSEELTRVFQSTPNLIGIEKIGNVPVAPPPDLSHLNQVGFSNLPLDFDGKIRRAILSVYSEDKLQFGLAAFTALQYLEKENLFPDNQASEKGVARFGDTEFTSLSSFSGGYGKLDSYGYQIMLNYRKPAHTFQTLPITDALEDRIPSSLIRDRIVYIGVTAPSLNDNFLTPYDDNNTSEMIQTPGVEIHAQITSQILSSVLDNRPLLKVVPTIYEGFLVAGFTFLGMGIIIIYLKPHQSLQIPAIGNITLSLLFIGGVTLCGSYGSFLLGWWIPVAVPLIALFTSASLGAVLQNQTLYHLAYLDGLTKISNRRCFDHYLNKELSSKKKLSLILCDIDYFKHFNDTYGHQSGDECLIKVANALRQATRPSDFVARYGGEEFAVILSNTDCNLAQQIAERMRKQILALKIPHKMSDVSDFVTLSCGVASVPYSTIKTVKELIEAADKALYESKVNGRNRVSIFNERNN
ncbi:MAG: CHASE2 domain-containing protein, partial [Cyanobacteria bacterium P01_E01_bin.6]